MHFLVDPALVGEVVRDTLQAILFQPPKSWQSLPESDVARLREAMAASGGPVEVRPSHVFCSADSQQVLSVSSVRVAGAETPEQQVDAYWSILEEHAGDRVPTRDAYVKDGLHITQLYDHRDGQIRFTLLFASAVGTLLQFDYLVSEQAYPAEVRALESSIGSIKPL
jgi:hypothetical protein